MDKKELFYVRPQDVTHEFLTLQKDEMHHLTNVHRKKKGDTFLAVDGMGTVYDCQIEQMRQDELQARIFKKYKFMGEPFFKLTLALALPKKGRFEWVVEKGTEIGVSAFMPLLTQRTVVKEKSLKPQRCMRIALAAMKQCQRSVLPTTAAPQKFESFCKSAMDFH
ncbi:MAG: RsmE family RNA methyltransferase, partial [bacterium]